MLYEIDVSASQHVNFLSVVVSIKVIKYERNSKIKFEVKYQKQLE